MIIGTITLSLVLTSFVLSFIGQTKNKGSLVKVSRVLGVVATLVCCVGYVILR